MFAPLVTSFLLVQLAWGLPQPQYNYDQHKVLEIVHKAEEDFRKLLEMELKYELDFWKLPKHLNDTMLVRVSPEHLQNFLSDLQIINADVKTAIENVQHLMDGSSKKWAGPAFTSKRAVSTRASGINLEAYHTHETIRTYMNLLVGSSLPNGMSATKINIGFSFEGRTIEALKLSSSSGTAPKRAIFIDGGIHAREWIAPATVLYFIEMLTYNPHNNVDIELVLTWYDIYLLPVVNPDGYEYTDIERLWRKNRKVNSGSSCVGVDLNRNFPFQWNPSVGGSTNPCSDIYSGSAPASEMETQNLVNYLSSNGGMFDAYLTLHSYGQMWLYPWGYTSNLPDDYQDLHDAAKAGIDAIFVPDRTRYDIGSSTNVLCDNRGLSATRVDPYQMANAAAGGSDDYAKGGAGIKYSYTLELRDLGRYGFSLPTSQILATADETLYGFLKFTLAMHNKESTRGH